MKIINEIRNKFLLPHQSCEACRESKHDGVCYPEVETGRKEDWYRMRIHDLEQNRSLLFFAAFVFPLTSISYGMRWVSSFIIFLMWTLIFTRRENWKYIFIAALIAFVLLRK